MAKLAVVFTLFCSANAYSLSRFTGAPVLLAPTTSRARSGGGGVRRDVMEAKKGKSNVPITQRGNQVASQKMQDRLSAMKPEANGMPVFNLYVQTELKNMWYPCGAFAGDSQSKQLVDGWQANALNLGAVVKGNIDRSVAGSIFAKEESTKRMVDQVVRMYPALKDSKKSLIFGYKIEYEGLEEEKQKISIITPEMGSKGPLDNLRKMFGGN